MEDGIHNAGEGLYPIAVTNPGVSYSFFTSIGYVVNNANTIEAGHVGANIGDLKTHEVGQNDIYEITSEESSLPPFATVLKLMKIR